MRHRRAGKKLGRNATHRKALYRNLAVALFQHERIITTLAKAKAVRPFVEKLITLARRGDLHARRLVIARLGSASRTPTNPSDDDNEFDVTPIVKKLFADIGPRFKERPGGYTRIIKRHEFRLGDGGQTAFLELLKEGEAKVYARPRREEQAPAPQVEDEPEEQQEQPAPSAPPAPEGAAPAAPSASSETPPAPAPEQPKS